MAPPRSGGSQHLRRMMDRRSVASPPATPPVPMAALQRALAGGPAEAATPRALLRFHGLLLRRGSRVTVAVLTCVSVLASVLLTSCIAWLTGPRLPELWVLIGTAALMPALIAPPLVAFVARVLRDTEAARERAERLSNTDPMTGAFNRRHFFDTGEVEFARAMRLGHALSVLLLDVDDFKRVNDTHGHAVGDRVLTEVARACTGCLREYDLLARYGGEEFVLLLPESDLAAAQLVAERVRSVVAELAIASAPGAPDVRPSVSVGVATLQPGTAKFDALVSQADAAMYGAKHAGKNRVNTLPRWPP